MNEFTHHLYAHSSFNLNDVFIANGLFGVIYVSNTHTHTLYTHT